MLVLGIFSLMIAVALPTVKISPLLLIRVTSIILLYAAALSFNAMYIQAIGSGLGIFSGLFQVTSVSQAIDVFIFTIGALVLLPWAPTSIFSSTKGNTSSSTALPSIPEYSLIILFTTCGATFLVSSADLVSMYLSIELQSFAVYILAALYRDSESATSAGLKYFLLGGLSSGLILLGSALIYAYTGLTNFEGIYSLLSVSSYDDVIAPVTIGLTITVVGFLFKVAAAPFHNWAPDVYDGTPTIVTAWLTIMPKISILVFLLELQSGLSGSSLTLMLSPDSSINIWKNLLLISSLLSLVIGTVVGLAQFRIKRLFAYSTISHVGFILLALSINSIESIQAFIFYLMQYSISNLNAFIILISIGFSLYYYVNDNDEYKALSDKNNSPIQLISQMKGLFYINPVLSLSLAITIFSFVGIPPLIGFFAKQMVLSAALDSGYVFLTLVAILTSVISAVYYLNIIKQVFFDKPEYEINPELVGVNMHGNVTKNNNLIQSLTFKSNNIVLSSSLTISISVLTLIILLFMFIPRE